MLKGFGYLFNSSSEHPDWVWSQFNRSVPMSTYLVAILVADYKYVEADKSLFHGKPVRVCRK